MSEVALGREDVCAVVVTFHPDERFPEVLERIVAQVNHTVIVDNSADAKAQAEILKLVSGTSNSEVIFNPRNMGQGHALNQGAWRAMELKYEWIVTFDQDSLIEPELVQTLAQIWAGHPNRERVRVVGPNFISAAGWPARSTRGDSLPYAQVKTVITSGCLLALAGIHEVGPFREDFFIDSIDHEYCLRLRRKGFIVLQSNRPLMRHETGRLVRYALPGRPFSMTNHSPVRRYYQARNRLLIARSYFRVEPGFVLWHLCIQAFDLILVPLLERERWAKWRGMWRGIWDGLRGRTGEAPNPRKW